MAAPRTPARRTRRARPRTSIRTVARESASTVYRDAIVAAASDEFTEQGYAATKMVDIARRAGMSVGALYRHFDSKEAIFLSIMLDASVVLVERMKVAAQVTDPAERLGALIATTLAFIEERRGMFQAFHQLGDADRASCAALHDQALETRDQTHAMMRTAITDGIADGTFRDDVDIEDQLAFVSGAIHGFLETWMRDDAAFQLTSKSRLIASLTLRALGGTP
jgi:AcrR family transcriptional regulator